MGRDAIAHLYGWIGGFLALYAISHWSVTQGGAAIEAVPGLDPDTPLIGAYFAVVVTGLLLTAVCLLGIAYVHGATTVDLAIPPLGLAGFRLSPGTWPASLYQGTVFFLVVVVPLAGLIHVDRKITGARIWNELTPAGASVPLGCAMPGWWPFGDCDATFATAAPALLGARTPPDENGIGEAGRLWVAEKACDIVWDRDMAGPQVVARMDKGGEVLSPDEKAALDTDVGRSPAVRALWLVAPYASGMPAAAFCAGTRDVGRACRKDVADCRGVTWGTISSPVLVIGSSTTAFLAAASYVLALCRRVVAVRRPRPAGRSADRVADDGPG